MVPSTINFSHLPSLETEHGIVGVGGGRETPLTSTWPSAVTVWFQLLNFVCHWRFHLLNFVCPWRFQLLNSFFSSRFQLLNSFCSLKWQLPSNFVCKPWPKNPKTLHDRCNFLQTDERSRQVCPLLRMASDFFLSSVFSQLLHLYCQLQMVSYTVIQLTQRAIDSRSTSHAWRAYRKLPTPGIEHVKYRVKA